MAAEGTFAGTGWHGRVGSMTGADIAARFEEINREAIDFILGPAGDNWYEPTEAEGWPVGVVARHIGLGHQLMTGWARGIKGHRPIASVGDINAINAQQAAPGVIATPAEVADLLRSGGVMVMQALRDLGPEDLAGTIDFGGQEVPCTMLAEAAVRHTTAHLESIKAAVSAVVG